MDDKCQDDRFAPAYMATAAIFLLLGIGASSWLIHIPYAKDKLALSPGELGVILLAYPIATLLTMPITGWLIARHGSRHVVVLASVVFCVVLPLPVMATDRYQFTAALMLFGMADGLLAVAINTHGSGLENRMGRPIMSSCHALFSIGGFIGSGTGGLLTSHGLAPVWHILGTDAGLLLIFLLVRSRLHDEPPEPSGAPLFARPNKALFGLAVIGFCVLLGEGAMASWSAVYLHEQLATSAGFAAYGYAAFSIAMAAGRLLGDRATRRLGPVAIVRGGSLLAALGLGAGLLARHPIAALIGFATIGLGYSIIFPLTISAAGKSRAMASGAAVAAVSSIGYFAFLVGPPVIGILAERLTVGGALGLIVAMSLMIAVLARSVDPRAAR